jgi:hypothetical protein
MDMVYRRLGDSGLEVSTVCLGTMMFGDRTDAAEARRIVDEAYAAGDPDGQALRQPARDRHAGQARHVDRQRAGIGQVHGDGIGQAIAEPERDGRRGRGAGCSPRATIALRASPPITSTSTIPQGRS